MNSNKAIKSAAKKQLFQNWSKAYAAMSFSIMASLCLFLAQRLVTSLLSNYGITKPFELPEDAVSGVGAFASYIIEAIQSKESVYSLLLALFFLVLRFLIISPLNQGHTKWYLSVAKGTKSYLTKMFVYFQSNEAYISLLLFKISMTIRGLLYGIVAFLAAVASLSLSIYQFSIYSMTERIADRNKALLYLAVTAFLILLGIILYILLMLKYYLAGYLFADQKKYNGSIRQVNECFTKSKKLMAGDSVRVISLVISFIPAIVSCVLIVPILYVYPYINCSLAVLASDIMRQSTDKKED